MFMQLLSFSANPQTDIHVLKFACRMMEGGNKNIQKEVLKYIQTDNHFLRISRYHLQKLYKTMRAYNVQDDISLSGAQGGSGGEGGAAVAMGENTTSFKIIHNHAGDDYLRSIEEEFRKGELLLRFLQLCCEGHFKELQDFLREQDYMRGSINLLKEIKACAYGVCSRISGRTAELATQILETITEFVQGPNVVNQHVIGDASFFKCVNMMMQNPCVGCTTSQRRNLKVSCTRLLLSILEGCKAVDTPMNIIRSLSLDDLLSFLDEISPETEDRDAATSGAAIEASVLAYNLLSTLADWQDIWYDDRDDEGESHIRTILDSNETFAKIHIFTGQVEITRGDHIERAFFPLTTLGRTMKTMYHSQKEEQISQITELYGETPKNYRMAQYFGRARHLLFLVRYQSVFFRTSFYGEFAHSGILYAKSFIPTWIQSFVLSISVVDWLLYFLYFTSFAMQILLVHGGVACPEIPVKIAAIQSNMTSAYDSWLQSYQLPYNVSSSPSPSPSLDQRGVYDESVWYKCDYPSLSKYPYEDQTEVFKRQGFLPGYRFTNKATLQIVGSIHLMLTILYFSAWVIVEGPVKIIENETFVPTTLQNKRATKREMGKSQDRDDSVEQSQTASVIERFMHMSDNEIDSRIFTRLIAEITAKTLMTSDAIINIIVLLSTLLGLTNSPFWFSISIMHYFKGTETANMIGRVLYKSLTVFAVSLLMLFTIIYLAAVMGFIIIRDHYKPDSLGNKLVCEDFYGCVILHLTDGFRKDGGIAESLKGYDPNYMRSAALAAG